MANRVRSYRKVIGILLLVEFILYDPLTEKFLYIFFYPYIMDSGQYKLFLNVTHLLTMLINTIFILISILVSGEPADLLFSLF